jgi:hypothetical protein
VNPIAFAGGVEPGASVDAVAKAKPASAERRVGRRNAVEGARSVSGALAAVTRAAARGPRRDPARAPGRATTEAFVCDANIVR